MFSINKKTNKGFLICMGSILFFAFISFISFKNIYDELFNSHVTVTDDFEKKLKEENKNPIREGQFESSEVESEDNNEPKKLKLNSLSALLMDGENNRVLYEVNGYKEMPMASTTKIMTCIVTLENGNLNDVVTISPYAARMPDVQLNVRAGEQYYLRDLLYSLMLESHNDVAVAIAEHVGGTVEGFTTMMNDKARELECYNTNFVTPNGLDAEGHYTTARDLAVISSYAIKNKDFLAITNTPSYQFKELKNGSRSFSVSNKNKFLYMMDGAIGVKTGFTGKAGYCFVGAVKKPDRILISVVLGCGWPPSKNLKWTDTKRLMTYGIENYEKRQIFEEIDMEPIYVEKGQSDFIEADIKGDLQLLLRKDEKIKIEYDIPDILAAPIEKGQRIGEVKYYINDSLYASIPVYANNESKRIDYRFCFMRVLKLWSLQY